MAYSLTEEIERKIKSREALVDWLSQWHFDRFITLTFNDAAAGEARLPGSSISNLFLTERVKKWDAGMNRKLVGKNWHKLSYLRMFNFYMLEKASSNPHWHGLVRFDCSMEDEKARQTKLFDLNAQSMWSKLVPRGTVDVQIAHDQLAVANYVAKSMPYGVSFKSFIVPDQFGNRKP